MDWDRGSKGPPVEIIEKLNKEMNAGSLQDRCADRRAGGPDSSSLADLDRFVIEQTEQWEKVIRAAKIKLD